MNLFRRLKFLATGTVLSALLSVYGHCVETLVWTTVSLGPDEAIRALESDGERLVRVIMESDGTTGVTTAVRIESSTDGVSWLNQSISGFDPNDDASVCHADGTWFVTVGELRYTSSDGITWIEAITSLPDENATVPRHWLCANGWHVHAARDLYGFATTDPSSRLRSEDGLRWVRIEQDFGDAQCEAIGADQFVVLSQHTRYISADGANWSTAAVSGLPDDPVHLVYFRGRWLCATTDWQDSTLFVSSDACRWHQIGSWSGEITLFHHQQLDRMFLAKILPSMGSTIRIEYFSSSDGFDWMGVGGLNVQFRHAKRPVALLDRVAVTDSTSQLLSPGKPLHYRLIRPGVLEWPTVDGTEYRVERSSDLSVNGWEAMGNWRTPLAGERAMFLIQAPEELEERQFYRVQARPASN